MMFNPDYADTMMLLAEGRSAAFYTGPIAEDIVAKVAEDLNPTGEATITMEDLAAYVVAEREPICFMYRDTWKVCGMPPPSSGGRSLSSVCVRCRYARSMIP
jgi:gamma-glutamyltranspeptidase/glutathione hydrolase